MADSFPQNLVKQLSGLTRLPSHRQFGLVVGLAVVIALGATLVLWAMKPPMRPLPGLDSREVAEAVNVLEQENIVYEVAGDGQLLVSTRDFPRAQMALSTEGLTVDVSGGYELLGEGGGLGESQERERARLQAMLQTELERAIMTFEVVRSATVNLGLPRNSGFLRDRSKPSASVVVTLHPGRELDDRQVAGIVASVASSVADLEPSAVSVVDQRGHLLSGNDEFGTVGGASRQLEYKEQIERDRMSNASEVLTSFLGPGKFNVSVEAEIDFTQTETTREIYDSAEPVVISEQITDEQTVGAPAGGVPGALTNQPPGEAVVADVTAAEAEAAAGAPTTRRSSSSRNFEVDRTIDHIRQFSPTISRLNVAVVVDHAEQVDEAGEVTRVARTPEELQDITGLVREAVGFSEARGDVLTVINRPFVPAAVPDAPPEMAIWQQPWVMDMARYGAGAVGVLLLIFMVVRPVLRSLAQVPPRPALSAALPEGGSAEAMLAQQAAGRESGAAAEAQLGRARQLATEDPRLAAQVVRSWISNDGK